MVNLLVLPHPGFQFPSLSTSQICRLHIQVHQNLTSSNRKLFKSQTPQHTPCTHHHHQVQRTLRYPPSPKASWPQALNVDTQHVAVVACGSNFPRSRLLPKLHSMATLTWKAPAQ